MEQLTAATPDAPAPGEGRRRRRLGALAGLLAAAVALGVAELVAGVVGPASSPVVAVGDAVITVTPEPIKNFAIRAFGENDKVALVVGTLGIVAIYALLIGLLSVRSRRLGTAGILLFGAIGAAAAATRPAGGMLDAVPSLVGAAAGIAALNALLVPLVGARRRPADDVPGGADDAPLMDRVQASLAAGDRKGGPLDRRRFFVTSGVVVGVAAVAGGAGKLVQRRFDVADAREDLVLPRPASPAPRLPADADLAREIDELTPLFTPNRTFYRVDTAISVPQVRPDDFRLTFDGMFDSPRSYTLAQLLDRNDLIERDVTLTCVSNEIGGLLAGTARWLGAPLGALLRENGIRSESTQLVCRSTDGMTIGTPTRSALEVEGAMLAFGMNGEPLPVEHGFPLRMVIPGLYGYVSACKWLTRIQATTFEAFDAYWVERGWAAQGPVKLASRIDTPASMRTFSAGRRPIAGVAWAQGRGIERVEVQVDDADWAEAQLSPADAADMWRQWVLPYDFRSGSHLVKARATATDGEVQTGDRADPFPDGATGWHTIRVITS